MKAAQNGLPNEFLNFMSDQGLSPGGPILVSELVTFGSNTPLAQKAIRVRMKRFCEKLAHEYEWEGVPEAYHKYAEAHDSWGRCAVVFPRTDGWAPGVGVGFYYDAKDHKVPFVNPGNDVDLYLRVQAWYQTNPSPSKVLSALREAVPLLQ